MNKATSYSQNQQQLYQKITQKTQTYTAAMYMQLSVILLCGAQ